MNLIERLRLTGSTISDRLRGMYIPQRELVFPNKTSDEPTQDINQLTRNENVSMSSDGTKQEIQDMKNKNMPLHKVLNGLDAMGVNEELKGFARQVYFGLVNPLTETDVSKQLPAKKQAINPKITEGMRQTLEAGKELAKAITEIATEPGASAIKPTLERVGVSPLLAGVVGSGADIAAPGIGKASAAKKMAGFIKPSTAIATAIASGIVATLLPALFSTPEEKEKVYYRGIKQQIERATTRKDFDSIPKRIDFFINDLERKAELQGMLMQKVNEFYRSPASSVLPASSSVPIASSSPIVFPK